MLTYLSNESRIIPLTMATRSSAKLLHSKSYAGGPQRHIQGRKKDPLKGQHANFIAITARSNIKLACKAPVVIISFDGFQPFMLDRLAVHNNAHETLPPPVHWNCCPPVIQNSNLLLLQAHTMHLQKTQANSVNHCGYINQK